MSEWKYEQDGLLITAAKLGTKAQIAWVGMSDSRDAVQFLGPVIRDLVDKRGGPPHMKEDIRTIVATASIDDAAKLLVDANLHHLIVIDDDGLAVGMLSALDVIRGLVGAEPKHPTSIERVRAQGSEGGGTVDEGSGSGDSGGTKGG